MDTIKEGMSSEKKKRLLSPDDERVFGSPSNSGIGAVYVQQESSS